MYVETIVDNWLKDVIISYHLVMNGLGYNLTDIIWNVFIHMYVNSVWSKTIHRINCYFHLRYFCKFWKIVQVFNFAETMHQVWYSHIVQVYFCLFLLFTFPYLQKKPFRKIIVYTVIIHDFIHSLISSYGGTSIQNKYCVLQ